MSAAKLSKKKTTVRKNAKKTVPSLPGQESDQQLISDLSAIGTTTQKGVLRIEVDSRRR